MKTLTSILLLAASVVSATSFQEPQQAAASKSPLPAGDAPQYAVDPNLPGLRAPLDVKPANPSPPRPELTEIWTPLPAKVTPAKVDGGPPSDAIVLFNGVDLSNWEALTGGPAKWNVEDRELVVVPYSGYIQTRESYGDCQLHVEWKPDGSEPPNRTGQDRSNSGIYFQGRYEVQILDSYTNPTYVNGQAGSIYKQFAPLVNASKPAAEWQSYDIVFVAPRFAADGKLLSPARMTVFQNGILVQNNVSLAGMTVFRGAPYYVAHGPAPLVLQEHHNRVRFRNLWLRRL
jgi:hypothetical protein